jgi:hypothetical protein
MQLNAIYPSKDEVPAEFLTLYTEREGKFEFSGVEGLKTQADVDRVQEALRKEREEHKKAKEQGRGALGAEEAQKLRDELEDAKAKLEVAGDPKKLDEAVEKRLAVRMRPLEREIERLKTELSGREQKIAELDGAAKRRTIVDAVRAATAGEKGIKIIDTALADIEFLAPTVFEVGDDGSVRVRDGAPGFTSGFSPRDWLAEVQTAGSRKHWFPANQGAGARGSEGGAGSGENPFAKDTFNLTAAMALVKSNPTQAKRLAQAVKRTDLLPKELQG